MTAWFFLAMIVEANGVPWSAQSLLGLLMILGGGAGLLRARKLLATAKTLAAVPVSPIGQAASGTARLRGVAYCEQPVVSPFSATRCCGYRVEIDQGSNDGGDQESSWALIHEEVSSASFWLRDASGAIQVRPEGLEVAVPVTAEDEAISEPRNERERILVEYVQQHCPNQTKSFLFDAMSKALVSPEKIADPRVPERLEHLRERHASKFYKETKGRSFRFREMCILPGQEYEIAGTITDEGSTRVLMRGAMGAPFLVSSLVGNAMDQEQRKKALVFAAWSAGVAVLGVLALLF
jgi:hypothetical protein